MPVCPTCHTVHDPGLQICPSDGTLLPTAPVPDQHVGSVLDGKYRIDSFISAGGMGSVYRGTHVLLDKTVAIKLIRRDLVTTPDVGTRFQREARAASNLEHQNIAAVSDFGQAADGTLYLVMEYVSGASLRDVIQRSGPMAPGQILSILGPIASALGRAHRQHIIHRDLKPHNIMLRVDADGAVTPKLLDFGIAKTFDETSEPLTMTGYALGTPQYMSPEQATGKSVDGRSDIYSLGVVLYEMLVGEVPFSDTSLAGVLLKQMTEAPVRPSMRRPDLDISPELEAVALRCLEKEPGLRFQSVEELDAALHRAVGTSSAGTTVRNAIPPAPGAVPPLPPGAPLAAHGTSPTLPAPPPLPLPPLAAGAGRSMRTAPWLALGALAALAFIAVGVRGLSRSSAPSVAVVDDRAPEAAADLVPTATTPAGTASIRIDGDVAATSAGSPAAAVPLKALGAVPSAQLPRENRAPTALGSPRGAATGTPAPASAPVPGPSPLSAGSPVAAPQAAPARSRAAAPRIFARCGGPVEVCGAIRTALADAMAKDGMPASASEERADVVLGVIVDIVEERAERSFGTLFVTRTYSADVEARSGDEALPMPQGRTFSFDARVGRERANEQARLLAADVVERVRAHWDGPR
ncbi:MAG: protein kinase [Vicinamibacterales bacterium]